MAETAPETAPRIYYLDHRLIGPLDRFPAHLDHIHDLGFDTLLLAPVTRPGRNGDIFYPADHDAAHPALATSFDVRGVLGSIAGMAHERGLKFLVDLAPQQFALEHRFVDDRPECFSIRRESTGGPVDPRAPASPQGTAMARLIDGCGAVLADYWRGRIASYLEAGVDGFRALKPGAASAEFWTQLIREARSTRPDALFIADTHSLPRSDALALASRGFDHLLSSLAWWDYRASWLAEEHAALSAVAPVIAVPEAPYATRLSERFREGRALQHVYERALTFAVASGCGLLVPAGFEFAARRPLDPAATNPEDFERARADAPFDLSEAIRAANALAEREPLLRRAGHLRPLTSPSAPVAGFLRTSDDPRYAERGLVVLANPDVGHAAEIAGAWLWPHMGGEFGDLVALGSGQGEGVSFTAADTITLGPGEVYLAATGRAKPVLVGAEAGDASARAAAASPRTVVDGLDPSVDGGRYAVKRVVGESIIVRADAFMDGHEVIAVELQWRALDEDVWRRDRMKPLGNDSFEGRMVLDRLGRHEYVVEAWFDRYGSFARDLGKKHDAGVDTALDLTEGRQMIEAARDRAHGPLSHRLADVVDRLVSAGQDAERVAILLAPETRALMDEADDRPFRARSFAQPVEAERTQAAFASWYELFPRSQTNDPDRHGTLRDVIGQLPRVRDMGFDVLYFTPIHPIGRKNRKGRNNTLTPGPDDPGSPYAIGAAEGGHDALHPELGTIEDFRALTAAAREHGLELALDFAIQCSPDHPWLKDHPGWFDYRPDGSIKYAENPPKKYEDIVNVDFYKPESIPDLWLALRDVILFWAGEGIRTFRVDNPHTKPLPFWEWMIGQVRAQYPDTLFLSEAFTRPKMMYHLAKIGFSQSYTYFTWRDTKAELTEYLTELSTTAPKDFYRPHFFVNTPDINPRYLQQSGRAGFLVRACLAATLSGLWGVYSGFELLESDPLPGKEEYRDSEKYEIRVRDWNAPGNIVPDIARLNRLRRANPALQSHLNVRFYNAWNDNILFYGKASPDGEEMILVAVNLDPHNVQACDIEVPLWEFGLPDHGALEVEDLIFERAFTWHGKIQHLRLDPHEYPFAIWRIRPHKGA